MHYCLVVVLAILQASLCAQAYRPQPAPFWWLNSFLDQKTIGRFEDLGGSGGYIGLGPCPSYGERCKFKFADLPQSVKDMGVTIPLIYETPVTIGTVLPQGSMEVYLLELANIEFDSITIGGGRFVGDKIENFAVDVKGFKGDIKTTLNLVGISLPGETNLPTIDVTVTVGKANQLRGGTNVSLDIGFEAPFGKTLSNSFPSNSTLRNCSLDLDLGLQLTVKTILPFVQTTNKVTNLIVGLVEPLLGNFICSALKQFFVTASGTEGAIQAGVTYVYENLGTLSGNTPPNVDAEELALINSVTEQQKEDSFNFATSNVVRGASLIVNNWLGASTSAPLVNEVVNLLTSPQNGSASFSNLESLGLSFQVATPPFIVGLTLVNASLSGMNTFGSPSGFQLLLNDYASPVSARNNYTIDNLLTLTNLAVKFTAKIELENNYGYDADGGWIFRDRTFGPDKTEFYMDYQIGLKDLDVHVALSIMTNPHELAGLQLGQLLGKSTGSTSFLGQALAGAKCSAPSMYGLKVPFLTLSLSDIVTPVFSMRPLDSGVTTLVNSATARILGLLESPIKNDLSQIANFWIRPLVNDLLSTAFTSSGSATECPEYESQGKISPNLLTSRLFSSVSTLMRDVIGGNPILNANIVSINNLLFQVVNFACEAFGSNGATCANVGPGAWDFFPDFSVFPGYSYVEGDNTFQSKIAITGVSVLGLDSVYTLLLDNLPGQAQGIRFEMALGKNTNPLTLILKNRWSVNYPASSGKADIDESFDLRIEIEGFHLLVEAIMDLDLNQLYLLRVEDLGKSACLLAPLLALSLPTLDMSMVALRVSTTTTSSFPGNGNALQTALEQVLMDEPYTTLTAMVNNVLSGVSSLVQDMAMNNTGKTTVYTCQDEFNAFDNVVSRIVTKLLSSNLTELVAKGFGAQPLVANVSTLDFQADQLMPFGFTPFDMSQSNLAKVVNNAVQGVGSVKFKEVLVDAASSSGDIIGDSLIIQPDGGVGLDLNITSLLPNGISLAGILEDGGAIYLKRLRVSNLTRVDMDNIKVLKPIGKYVTQTHIAIPGTLSIVVDLAVQIPRSFKNLVGPDLFSEISFAMDLVDLDIAVQLVSVLSLSKTSAFTLGNFIQVDQDQTFSINPNMWGCIFGLSYSGGFYFPELKIGVSEVGAPRLTVSNSELLSYGTVDTVNVMLDIFSYFFAKDLKDLTQGVLRSTINDFFLVPNLERNRACPNPTPPALYGKDRILNFEKSSTMKFLHHLTTDVMSGADGKYSLVNSLLGGALDQVMFLDRALGNFVEIGDVPVIYKKQTFGSVRGGFGSLMLNRVGTIRSLNLFEAMSNTSFYNNFSFSGPLSIDAEVSFTISDLFLEPNTSQTNNVFLTLVFTNVSMGFGLNVEIDLVDLMVVRAESLTQLSQISCVATAFDKFATSRLSIDVGKIGATLRCIDCESALLAPLNNGGELTTGDSDTILDMLPIVVDFVETYLGSYLFNDQAQQTINTADETCAQTLNLTTIYPVFNAPEQPHLNVAVILALTLLGAGCGLVVLFPLAIPRHYQLRDKMLAEQLQMANSQPGANPQSVARFMAKEERLSIAMAFHPAVDTCCKCFVPIMAIINVVLLALSFIVYLSFSVDVVVYLAGERSRMISLVPWYISSTINDMWNSGAQPIALLIVFASCAWPVLKNLALFAIWYAPRTFLNHHSRMKYLVVLDILGKWSFLDVYIVVLLVGGLRFKLYLSNSPYTSLLPLPQYLLFVDVIVTPGTGIVILCIAAFMSLVVNHIIIWQLEKLEFSDRRLFKQIDGEDDDMLTAKASVRLAICDYVFSTSAPNGERDRFSPRAKYGLVAGIFVTFIFLLVGMIGPYFIMTYTGLVGYALAFFIEGGKVKTFTLFGLVGELGAAGDGTVFYNVLFAFFQILYVITVIVTPFLQLVIHLVLWLYPLSRKDAHTLLFASKVVAYWASLEVFATGIVAMTIEIKPVTSFLFDFITGGGCTALLVPLTDLLGKAEGTCLDPGATLGWGFGVSFVSNLMQIGFGAVMLRASGVAMRDRDDVLERRPHQQWTLWEYRVLNVLLVNGAQHHKPPPAPAKKISCKFEKISCKTDDCAQSCSGLCSCFNGVQDVSLTTDNKGKKIGGASKWNTAAPIQNQNWNASQSYAQPSRTFNSVEPANSHIVSSNPVFNMESQKPQHYSVDV